MNKDFLFFLVSKILLLSLLPTLNLINKMVRILLPRLCTAVGESTGGLLDTSIYFISFLFSERLNLKYILWSYMQMNSSMKNTKYSLSFEQKTICAMFANCFCTNATMWKWKANFLQFGSLPWLQSLLLIIIISKYYWYSKLWKLNNNRITLFWGQ